MKIGELIQVPGYGDLLASALSKYCDRRFGVEVRMQWKRARLWDRILTRRRRLYCNPRVDAVFSATEVTRKLARNREIFSRTTKRGRFLVQWPYVQFATRWRGAIIAATYVIDYDQDLKFVDDWVVMGGRRRFRVADVKRNTIACVPLDEVFVRDLRRECCRRRELKGLPYVPQILQYDDEDYKWFEEEFVEGVGLNRMAEVERALCQQDLYSCLGDLAGRGRQNISVGSYCDARVAECARWEMATIENASPMQGDAAGVLKELLAGLESLIRDKRRMSVSCGLSHGDVQDGNVLGRNGRIWLIDWEEVGVRSVMYDAMCYELGARRPYGLADRSILALDDVMGEKTGWLFNLLCDRDLSTSDCAIHFALFLADEVCFWLRQVSANVDISNITLFAAEGRRILGYLQRLLHDGEGDRYCHGDR